MNTSTIYGLIAGLLSMGLLTVLYLNNPDNMLTGLEKFSWLLILLAMFIGVARERGLRKEPFIEFSEALRSSFKIFIIAYLLKFVFIYILFNFADPSLLEKARLAAVKIFTEHRNADITQEIFDQQLDAFGKGYFGPRIFDIGVMLELIVGFLLSLATAAIMKREKPDY